MAVDETFAPDFGDKLAKAREWLRANGVETNIISGRRSEEDQRQLIANAAADRAGQPLPYPARGHVPMAAAVGDSPHQFGYGADVQAVRPGDQSKVWEAMQKFGLHTIGAGDPNHVDLPNWKTAMNTGVTPGSPSRPATPTPGPLMFGGLNPDARGMRNNNPGNLVDNPWTQKLPGYKGSDGRFAIFDTPEHGAAALDQNLTSYGGRGINTPLGIASTWAPAGDNNDPNSYGGQIAKALGVGPNDKIDMTDPAIRNKVAGAIGMVENGPGKSAGFRTAYAGSGGSGVAPTATAATPAAPDKTGVLPGFTTKEASDKFQTAMKGLTGGGDEGQGQGQEQPQAPQPIPAPPAMGVSPLLGMIPSTYGQTINSLTPALQAQAAPMAQQQTMMQDQQPMGTTINSLAQLRALYGQQDDGGYGYG